MNDLIARRRGGLTAVIAGMLEWLARRIRGGDTDMDAGLDAVVELPRSVAVPSALPASAKPALTLEGIVGATARTLWIHRGSLVIEVISGYDGKGGPLGTSPGRRHEVTLPGGMKLSVDDDANSFTLNAPDGQSEYVSDGNGGEAIKELRLAWIGIQGLAIAEELGIPIPERAHERPYDFRQAISKAIGEMAERAPLVPMEGTYVNRTWDRGDGEYKMVETELPTPWVDLGGVRYMDESGYDKRKAYVLHPIYGSLKIPHGPIAKGVERRRYTSFADALGMAHEQPVHLPMPRGNAQAARVLRLCREAIAVEPDLVDARGTPIAPLVNRHLPELMRRHAEATQSAPADQLATIDAELMQGIETVRQAVDEALRVSANAKRDALREQLAFLEMRHPGDGGLLALPGGDAR